MEYFLAVDIGASSGRHILGWLEDNKLKTEEIYRFDNGMKNVDGCFCWDVDALKQSVIEGMKKCRECNKIPSYMGIDTWAVDYVLLDKNNNILGKTYGYRDSRTEGMDREVYKLISQEELYSRTGIQKQIFNTIFQLMAHKIQEPQLLSQAEDFLMIPDYLNFILTGKKSNEYTNASTTGLVNAKSRNWDDEIISKLGFPRKIFKEIKIPGTILSELLPEICRQVGYNLKVVLPATHDTGSAVMAVPFKGNGLYISSGTWSLMGTEDVDADCSEAARMANMTNEGGFDYRFRYLKNIMGLWMIQSVRNEYKRKFSFEQLCDMAESEETPEIINVNDDSFLNPESMIGAITVYCTKHGFKNIPDAPGKYARIIYESLADSYNETAKELEKLKNKTYDCIYVVGGGCNAGYLNRLTAQYTGKTVYAGPSEATAIGNIMAQMIGTGQVHDIIDARKIIFESVDIKEYKPKA